MMTLDKISVSPNWGTRPTDYGVILGNVWLVEKGQPYNLVQFSIKELGKPYYWNESLCVPTDWDNEKIEQVVQEYVKLITEENVQEYRKFLEDGEKWGWD